MPIVHGRVSVQSPGKVAHAPYVHGAATTLCALHYMACSISIWITQGMGYVKRVSLPTQGAAVSTSHR